MDAYNPTEKKINLLQILIGILSLFIGVMVYFISRPPDEAYFIYHFRFMLGLHHALSGMLPNLFGYTEKWMPDFVHVFAFILITAGVLSCGKRGVLVTCISWFLVDFAFELGQKYNSFVIGMIPDWFSGIPILGLLKGYFRAGFFDLKDLMAIAAGTAAAYIVLILTMDKDH